MAKLKDKQAAFVSSKDWTVAALAKRSGKSASSAAISANSLLTRLRAVKALSERCANGRTKHETGSLRESFRKAIDYAIKKGHLSCRGNTVRLGDAARVLVQRRGGSSWEAHLRDIMDAVPINVARSHGVMLGVTGSGVSLPQDRAHLVELAVGYQQRIIALESQLRVCIAAAERRATIAEQKAGIESTRKTLAHTDGSFPSDPVSIFRRHLLKKKASPSG